MNVDRSHVYWLILALLTAVPAVHSADESESSPVAVPDKAAREDADRLVKDLYKSEFHDTSVKGRSNFAATLLKEGLRSGDKPAAQYVLLLDASQVAAEVPDVDVAMNALDELSKRFRVEAGKLKAGVLASAVRAASDPKKAAEVELRCWKTVGELTQADQYAEANDVAALAVLAARNSRSASDYTDARARASAVTRLKQEYGTMKPAAERLKTNPDDPEANGAVGRFFCFAKDDWSHGLPLLSRGADAALKSLADGDAAASADPKLALTTADAWWHHANRETGAAKAAVLHRAAYWYSQALPNAPQGLDKVKIEKRLMEIKQSGRPSPTWISQNATYTPSSIYSVAHFDPSPNLLNGKGGPYMDGLAFHTEAEDSPNIVIDLGRRCDIAGMEIINRGGPKGGPGPEREQARTLTAYISDAPSGPWDEFWRAENAEGVWTVPTPLPASGRYVKLALREPRPLHLYSVKLLGWPASSP